ncbi:hypothetical protein [Variovorax sp.]
MTLREAACLIAGIDPASPTVEQATNYPKAMVIERAMMDAIERANQWAWLSLDDKLPEEMPPSDGFWSTGVSRPGDYLPSFELLQEMAAIFREPAEWQITTIPDPEYRATLQVQQIETWLAGNGLTSAFQFAPHQEITATTLENNFASQQHAKPSPYPAGMHRQIEEAPSSAKTPAVDRVLGTRERNNLHAIIGVLCTGLDFDLSLAAYASGVAKKVTALADAQGVVISESTIESHLKLVADAIARKKA